LKRVRVSELVPGLTTAEDVYSFNNQLVVEKGAVLDDSLITRLEYYSVLSIRVNDDNVPDYSKSSFDDSNVLSGLESLFDNSGKTDSVKTNIPKTNIPIEESNLESADNFSDTSSNLTYSERIRSTKRFKEFQKNFISNTNVVEGHLREIVENNSIDTNLMLNSVTSLISKGTTSIGMFDMLHNMRSYDDQTYVHSMSVSLICNIFGRWLNLPEDELQVLTLAGLLHDIGKMTIPGEIIRKPAKLTNDEFQKMKQHTIEGYKLLKPLTIDERIKDTALLHHERCDGSGYPLGVTGEKLSDFAKIVAIADVYDAMTAARVYRGPQCPFKVISIFEDEGLQKYDSEYILVFLRNIGQTYVNNRVRLNDGREGDVVLIHDTNVSRPMIKCTDGRFIDLAKENRERLYIESLL